MASAPAAAIPRDRWLPTPFIAICLALHVLAFLALAVEIGIWPWVLAGLAGIHALAAAIALFPRNRLLGANITRLPAAAIRRQEIALTFDDGPDPVVTPLVLDLLDAYQARATFFCIAGNARAYPHLVHEIQRRGHQIENHSDRHSLGFAFFGYRRMGRDIDRAQVAIAGMTGRAPRFFRAPAGIRNPWLDPILHVRGLTHVAWTRRGFDTVLKDPARICRRLSDNLASGDLLLLHDGGSADTAAGRPVILEALPKLLSEVQTRGLKPVTLTQAFAD